MTEAEILAREGEHQRIRAVRYRVPRHRIDPGPHQLRLALGAWPDWLIGAPAALPGHDPASAAPAAPRDADG